MSGDLEGGITIALGPGADGRPGARIRSSRPQVAQRLMAGRAPPEVAHLARSLFALCGHAQGLAADWACRAARGEDPQPSRDSLAPVLTEVALEHLWYLLAGPTTVDRTPDLSVLLPLRQASAVPERLADKIEEILAGWAVNPTSRDVPMNAGLRSCIPPTPKARPGGTRGEIGIASPEDWISGPDRGRSTAPLLPTLPALADIDARALAEQALETPQWCARPTWRGHPAETGAIARQANDPRVVDWLSRRGRGIGARRLARLLELAELPPRLRGQGPQARLARSWSLGGGVGMAGVETARGLLLHVARLSGDRVSDYRIVAPTEWNFHPQGPVAEALAEVANEPDPRMAAREIAECLDACVAIQIENT